MFFSTSYKFAPLFALATTGIVIVAFQVGPNAITILNRDNDSCGAIDRGDALKAIGMHREALIEFDNAARFRDQNLHPAIERRAVEYLKLGAYHHALADVNEALLVETCSKGLSKRGTIKLKLGHNKSALADLNRAIEIEPDYRYAYRERAIAHEKLKQYNAAIKDYDKAISLGWRNGIFPRTMLVLKTKGILGLLGF